MSKIQKGFSLVEVLLVLTIIAVISVISIPWLQKTIGTNAKEDVYSSLATVSAMQASYFAKHNRYGSLDELHAEFGDSLGTLKDSKILRDDFILMLSKVNQSDIDLEFSYQILATKKIENSSTPCVLLLESTGAITEVFGDNCFADKH